MRVRCDTPDGTHPCLICGACRQLEAEERYDAAAAVDADVLKLRRQECNRRRHSLEAEQLGEMAQLEQQHQHAFVDMQHLWLARRREQGDAHSSEEAELRARHAREAAALREVRRQSSLRR